jgi:hypothetical protein
MGASDYLMGVFSISFGTLAAVLSVPENVQEESALLVPAVYLTAGLAAAPILRALRDPANAFWIENALIIGVVYWILLDLLQSAYPLYGVSYDDVVTAFWCIGAFAGGIWTGAVGHGWPLPRVVRTATMRPVGSLTLFIIVVVSFLLCMLKFAAYSGFDLSVMLEGLGAPRFNAPWSRGQSGGIGAFLDHLEYFGYPLPSLCVILGHRLGWAKPRVLVSILLTAVVLLFLSQAGGRRIIGVVVGAGLFTWMVGHGRLTLKVALGITAGASLLLVALQEVLRYRNVGFSAWMAGERPDLHVAHLHVDDNFLRLSQIISIFPEHSSYVYFKPVFQAMLLPIPRVFWPGKPLNAGFDLAEMIGATGVSLSSSIIGELYASFGATAVILGGLFIGRLAGMWNKVLQVPGASAQPLIFSLGVMVLFAGLRSLQALVQMSYIVLAWLIVTKVVSMRMSRSPSATPASRDRVVSDG